jgi:hypothetical protein
MRTTTGKFRAEQPWDAADLSCRHLPELVPLLGMDRDLWIKVSVDGLPLSFDWK